MKLKGPKSQPGRHYGRKNICHSRASNLELMVLQIVSCHYTNLFQHIILISKAITKRQIRQNRRVVTNRYVRQAYYMKTRSSAGGSTAWCHRVRQSSASGGYLLHTYLGLTLKMEAAGPSETYVLSQHTHTHRHHDVTHRNTVII